VSRAVGILAGGGSLPREIAEHVVARGGAVHIVALAGEAGEDLSPFPVTTVAWGKIGAMLGALRSAGCRKLVIVGSVRRPDLAALRPDLGFLRNLPSILRIIRSGGDDGVLSRVVRFFEEQGFEVVGPGDVAPDLIVKEGPLGHVAARPEIAADVALGFDVIRALGPFDVGQAVVVAGGRLEAIEGAEGTDAMLKRVAAQRKGRPTRSGVLVKRPKPGQELRVDLPAIGPGTVQAASEARLAGIAVLAGGVLAAGREQLVADADANGLFVQGFRERGARGAARATQEWRCVSLNNRAPNAQESADAGKGADLIKALGPLVSSRGAVVDRGHVLAVESGEGVAALIERAGALRQWGRQRWGRATGVAVLRSGADLEPAIADAAAARLSGLVAMEMPPPGPEPVDANATPAKDAERLKLFLAALTPSEWVK
jgi:DUF1009 family protein